MDRGVSIYTLGGKQQDTAWGVAEMLSRAPGPLECHRRPIGFKENSGEGMMSIGPWGSAMMVSHPQMMSCHEARHRFIWGPSLRAGPTSGLVSTVIVFVIEGSWLLHSLGIARSMEAGPDYSEFFTMRLEQPDEFANQSGNIDSYELIIDQY